jgi:hypothetical protein
LRWWAGYVVGTGRPARKKQQQYQNIKVIISNLENGTLQNNPRPPSHPSSRYVLK